MTKIKFCGFTNLEDLQSAIELKVDYVGFIIVKNSQRYIGFEDSVELIDKIEGGGTKTVAVVQNPSENLVQKIMESEKFDAIQFHGDETVKDCEKYKNLVTRHSRIDKNPTTPQPYYSHGNKNPSTTHARHSHIGGNPPEIWKAFSIEPTTHDSHSQPDRESTQIKKIKNYKNSVDKILLDLPKDSQSKESFSALEIYKKLEKEGFDVILAGGINLKNVEFYLKELNPKIIDIARGIEVEPGKKDMSKMIKMVEIK